MRNITKLKELIKEESENQVVFKRDRKTVNHKGGRLFAPHAAIFKHKSNRDHLRHLHHAYQILRDRPIPVYKKVEVSTRKIDKLLEQYAWEEELIEQ